MRNNYSLTELLSNIYAFFMTKIFYKNARLIRRPIYMRGKSSLTFGKGLTTGHACRFDLPGSSKKTLFIGKNCEIGDNVHIVALKRVEIGDNCLIASKVFISDTNHGDYRGNNQSSPESPPNKRQLSLKEVLIGKNVWIGENVCILPGVKVGNGCIIGANSIVNKNIPDNCIVAGSPARVVKLYNSATQSWERLEK